MTEQTAMIVTFVVGATILAHYEYNLFKTKRALKKGELRKISTKHGKILYGRAGISLIVLSLVSYAYWRFTGVLLGDVDCYSATGCPELWHFITGILILSYLLFVLLVNWSIRDTERVDKE